MALKRHEAVTPARDRASNLRRRVESTRTARMVVPQLDELAALISSEHLARIRTEVTAGERVAIYVRQPIVRGSIGLRVVIVGASRRHTSAPRWIDGEWKRMGVVEITEDGERALPELCS